jgi:hypothetical protein
MDIALAVLLRPLTALLLFIAAALLGRQLLRHLPDGRIRRTLATRIEVVPDEPASPRARRWAIGILAVIAGWLAAVEALRSVGWLD